MTNLLEFIHTHFEDDPAKLILAKSKWPDIDVIAAANTISTYRRLKSKVPTWYACPNLIFPYKLASEQCSSEATARYKAHFLTTHIAPLPTPTDEVPTNNDRPTPTDEVPTDEHRKLKIADITSGMGIDDYFFTAVAEMVVYNDMNPDLVHAAQHNFDVLDVHNVVFTNQMIVSDNINEWLGDFRPDVIFADPARRSSDGKKVFLIEDCSPDILGMLDAIFANTRHLLLKLSPMADITMVCNRLGRHCREVHVIGYEGECKELLIWMDREWNDDYRITCVEIQDTKTPLVTKEISFNPSDEKNALPLIINKEILNGAIQDISDRFNQWLLFEPGKALMKAGCFNILTQRWPLLKLGRSTHLYLLPPLSNNQVGTEPDNQVCTKPDNLVSIEPDNLVGTEPDNLVDIVNDLRGMGKIFRIKEILPLNNKNIKAVGKAYPHSEVTAKNLPMTSEVLRKKMSVASGDDAHIFGLKTDTADNLLFITDRL